MNINEIETILETLHTRHANLDEAMLITLLTAGGWEEKNIRDATVLFRATSGKRNHAAQALLIPPEENHLLPSAVDIAHTLTEHAASSHEKEKDTAHISLAEDASKEISSLSASPSIVVEKTEGSLNKPREQSDKPHSNANVAMVREDAIPDNLPLRPFESNSHIWPFSLYKDVFNGPAEPLPQSVPTEKKKEEYIVEDTIGTSSVSGKEDKLTILAEIMLGIVLLILAYMYSNGRL